MAASIELETDAHTPITSFNWGAIQDGASNQFKFFAKNVGDQAATSVIISDTRLQQNDGVDLVLIAPDVAGNPGAFSATPLNVGTLIPGDSVAFWLKVSVPSGTSPSGNPRQFDTTVDYRGT